MHGCMLLSAVICQERALQAVAALRNFARPGVTQASLDDPSSVFLSSYNDADYVIHSPQRRARYGLLHRCIQDASLVFPQIFGFFSEEKKQKSGSTVLHLCRVLYDQAGLT